MKPIKILAALALLLVAIPGVQAQNGTVSPYSRFGYGTLNDNASSAQRAMGGIGYAMNNGRQINPMNPASYAAIDSLTFLFDIGVDFKQLVTRQDDLKGHRFTAGLDYITMQFPIFSFMGASLGILPYSEIGYQFGNVIVNGEEQYQGHGSINELYFGLSARPFKGFTIGANAGYLFGTLINDVYLTPDDASQALFEQVIDVRDYNLRFGAQYSFNVGSHALTLGAAYSPGKSFLGHSYGTYYDLNYDQKPDTIGYTDLKGKFTRPDTWGAGINYRLGSRIMAEADLTYQPWSKAVFTPTEGFETTRLTDRWKIAAGAQYMPDTRGNYFHRVRYRLGASFCRDYVLVGNNNVNEFSVTCGLGLPAPVNRFTKTVVNVGFEYRHRSTSPATLVTENYFQITLGVNFNELWFWQNKIQ